MHRIFKYQVDRQKIKMPVGAKILHAGMQGNGMFIWAMVDDTQPEETRRFITLPTGMAIADDLLGDLVHISTVQAPPYVWHVFEVIDA